MALLNLDEEGVGKGRVLVVLVLHRLCGTQTIMSDSESPLVLHLLRFRTTVYVIQVYLFGSGSIPHYM